jgi:hypothetical protein
MAWELSASPTCLLNGPASTRCWDFRRASSPFEPSLRRRRSPLPGNGISRAEKKAQYVPRATDQRSQRRSGRSKTPPIRGLSHACRKSPRMWDCVVAHVVQVEPVSNSNSLLTGRKQGTPLGFGSLHNAAEPRNIEFFQHLHSRNRISEQGHRIR